MAVKVNSEEGKILRSLIPLETFPKTAFEELCTNITIEQVQDDYLFKRGDQQPDLVYLLSGSVTLQALGLVIEVIEAQTASGRFALAHQIPRKIDAFANGVARFVRLNADLVNNPPTVKYENNDGYTIIEESDIESEADDWLNVLLRLPLFQSLPARNLQKLLTSITITQFAAGDVIVDTGSPVAHFYVVNRGQCVRAKPSPSGYLERKVSSGETFGDEYLLLDIPCNEKISAFTDVTLIQLAKAQFTQQIIQPLLKQIDEEEKNSLLNAGALLLDVRTKQQAEKNPLETGIHIPYLNLSAQLADLDVDRKIITYADEKTSMAAAFLLFMNNFAVFAFNNGSEVTELEIAEGFPASSLTAANTTSFIAPLPAETEEKNSGNPGTEKSQGNLPEKMLDPKAELRFLRMENKRLTAYTTHLEEKIAHLKIENQKTAMRTQLLALQLKKLKEIMTSYSKK